LACQSLLLQPLDSSNSSLIGQVAEATIAIARFKDPRSVNVLLEASQNLSRAKGLCRDGVYSWVLKALGKMYDFRALPQINDALQDDSPLIRKEAQNALLELRKCNNAYLF
jgi:HEAT repeat protein